MPVNSSAHELAGARPRMLAATLVSGLLLALGACRAPVHPAPDKMAAWTTQLRDAQPEDPFAAVYVHGRQRLVVLGVKHENRTDSPTFHLIENTYAAFSFDTVIVEGAPYSGGRNPEKLMKGVDAQREVDGFVEGGETVPAVRGARAQRADVWGGEPDDAHIRDQLLARGVTPQDLLGFYTLRSIPQWIGERKITSAADDRITALLD